MNILVATDGVLDPDRAADAVARLYQPGDQVIVFTALNIPVDFLRGLSLSGVKAAADIAREAGHPMLSGGRAAERLMPIGGSKQKPSPSSVVGALTVTAAKRTTPLVEALAERGVTAEGLWQPTENQTAKTIIRTLEIRNCELVIIGSHGRGRFDGLLGSTGTKLVRNAPSDVMILRHPARG